MKLSKQIEIVLSNATRLNITTSKTHIIVRGAVSLTIIVMGLYVHLPAIVYGLLLATTTITYQLNRGLYTKDTGKIALLLGTWYVLLYSVIAMVVYYIVY